MEGGGGREGWSGGKQSVIRRSKEFNLDILEHVAACQGDKQSVIRGSKEFNLDTL